MTAKDPSTRVAKRPPRTRYRRARTLLVVAAGLSAALLAGCTASSDPSGEVAKGPASKDAAHRRLLPGQADPRRV
jgi:hypothetical protein